MVASLLLPLAGHADVTPTNNPDNATGVGDDATVTPFDWQKEWGTLHLETPADDLGDPGASVSSNGLVGCPRGILCNQSEVTSNNVTSKYLNVPHGNQVRNGIKFDIKNSVQNCMARPVVNKAINNPWDSDTTVCLESFGLMPIPHNDHDWCNDYTGYGGNCNNNSKRGMRLVYLPLWDKRSSDARQWNSGESPRQVGCEQQIINNCAHKVGSDDYEIVRDIHQCVKSNDSDDKAELMEPFPPPAVHYVDHVFSKEELNDIGNPKKVPNEYWVYQKKLSGGKSRTALALVDPREDHDLKDDIVEHSKVEHVEFGPDSNLARLKSFRFDNKEKDADFKNFIVVDPSDFFDLRLYTSGGKYDAGYREYFTYNRAQDKTSPYFGQTLVSTLDSCPVLGLGTYGGICDPGGKAGCNLPIYGEGPETTLHGPEGSYTYRPYPIKWSGYVTKWALLGKGKYLANIRGREDIYLTDKDFTDGKPDLNDNPILMVTRANEYCDDMERSSDLERALTDPNYKPDMACVQYLQYQDRDGDGNWAFVDLYVPKENEFSSTGRKEANVIQLYDIDEKGLPMPGSPVKGTGTNRLLPGRQSCPSGGCVSFMDNGISRAMAKYTDKRDPRNPKDALVFVNNYDAASNWAGGAWHGGEVLSSVDHTRTSGKGLGSNANMGSGMPVHAGTAAVIIMPRRVDFPLPGAKPNAQGKVPTMSASCFVASYMPKVLPATAEELKDVYLPTNSPKEFKSFVLALGTGKVAVDGLQIQPCDATFQANSDPSNPVVKKEDPTHKNPRLGQGWIGMTSCDQLETRPACNEVKLISAKRFCQLENGSMDSCGACAASPDPDKDIASHWKPEDSKNGVNGDILASPSYNGANCFFMAACYNNSNGCPGSGTSGGHVFCLSGDTKIAMADGTEKAISKIKAGDKVKSFNAKHTRNAVLGTAKVSATAVTKKQRIVQINNLKITPLHKIVLANGRAIMAKDVKVGDHILNESGLSEEVTTVNTKLAPITVYNLVLDNKSDGYVAGGLRVMSYPILKGEDGEDQARGDVDMNWKKGQSRIRPASMKLYK